MTLTHWTHDSSSSCYCASIGKWTTIHPLFSHILAASQLLPDDKLIEILHLTWPNDDIDGEDDVCSPDTPLDEDRTIFDIYNDVIASSLVISCFYINRSFHKRNAFPFKSTQRIYKFN